MLERIVNNNNITLWTESFGDVRNPTIVFISGAGASSRFWTDAFIKQIVDFGYFVIRFDHRDSGLSSAVDFEKNPYTVLNLAKDVIAILDAYNIEKAHVVGHSMGGTIVQLLAIHYPQRVLSITSMSVGTVGEVAAPSQETMDVLLENKPTQNFEESLPGFMESWKLLNGNFEVDQELATEYTKDLYERSNHPVGVARNHIKAQEEFTDLSVQLKSIVVPAFFIHGQEDLLIPVQAGIATAKVVSNAKIDVIPDMGHMIFNRELEQNLANILILNFKSVHNI